MAPMQIDKRIEFKAPIERVWKAITDPEELSQWFPDRTKIELQPGALGYFEWDEHGRCNMRVELVEAPTHLVWSWMNNEDVPYDAARATRVEWKLTSTPDGGTVLELTETGFETQKSYEENTHGWQVELGELVEFLEKAPAQ